MINSWATASLTGCKKPRPSRLIASIVITKSQSKQPLGPRRLGRVLVERLRLAVYYTDRLVVGLPYLHSVTINQKRLFVFRQWFKVNQMRAGGHACAGLVRQATHNAGIRRDNGMFHLHRFEHQ